MIPIITQRVDLSNQKNSLTFSKPFKGQPRRAKNRQAKEQKENKSGKRGRIKQSIKSKEGENKTEQKVLGEKKNCEYK